jgi:MSHA biogenesis protein MshO
MTHNHPANVGAHCMRPNDRNHANRAHSSAPLRRKLYCVDLIISGLKFFVTKPTFTANDRNRNIAGFTLVELVVTIVIIGILSSMGGMFITKPIEGYIDLERRTELVDQAEMALRRMQRDIRAALPNSVRTFDGGKGIEFLHVVDGGRYRRAVDPAAADSVAAKSAVLDFTTTDNYFEVLGGLTAVKDYVLADCLCVIYNLTAEKDVDVANAYATDYSEKNIVDILSESADHKFLTLDEFIKFPYASPYNRFFIVDEVISYQIVGNETIGYKLRRYAYPVEGSEVGPPDDVLGDLVATHLDVASTFSYDSATTRRSGLVTMQLALENNGERITLLHQVHVDNAP